MMRGKATPYGSRHILGLIVAAILAAAVSSLPAGSGNLGSPTQGAGGTVTIKYNPTNMVTITAGESISNVRADLLTAINSDANFSGAAITDPNDPNSIAFSVTKAGGGEIDHLQMCETDPNLDSMGVVFAGGKQAAMLNIPTAVAANGNYVLTISTWDHGTTTQTFNTTTPPNNTVAGLTASIMTSFTAAGFTVRQEGPDFVFMRPGDMITALRVSSSDTGSVSFCLDVTSNVPTPIPTVSEVGAFLLVLLMTGSAIWMLRRKGATTNIPS